MPTLEGDDEFFDNDSDVEKSKPNLIDLVQNARSTNPDVQLTAIQCKSEHLMILKME